MSNSTMDAADVCGMLRRVCAAAGGVAPWARSKNISPGYVADVVAGRTSPGPSVLHALGLKRITRYAISREENHA